MNRMFQTWYDVARFLEHQPRGSVLRLEKYQVQHPADAGMAASIGLPLGQSADWRSSAPECAGLHVRDFETYYSAHLDVVNPRCDLPGHITADTPQVAGGLAFGALLGAAFGKSKEATLVGAMLGGLLGLAAAVSAADTSEKKARS